MSRNRRIEIGFGTLVLLLVMGSWLVSAQQGDGRINTQALLGGAAIYCIGSTNQPAANYAGGGIRVLEAEGLPMGGEELLFVPDTRIDEVDVPLVNTLLGEGTGPYGSMQLYRLTSGEFSLVGYEEPGKVFQFVWKGCGQVNAAVDSISLPTNTLPSVGSTSEPSSTAGGPTATPTNTSTATDTFTPTNTPTATDTFTPTNTPTATDTFTPTATDLPS